MSFLIAILLVSAPQSARDAISAQIEAALPKDLGLVSLSLPRALETAQPPISIEWRAPPKIGTVSVQVIAKNRRGWVTAKLEGLQNVVVAAADLNPGDTISDLDFKMERRAAVHNAAPASVLGRTVIAPIKEGEPITKNALAQAAPLPRGTEVTALVRSGEIEVAAPARLERNAEIGGRAIIRINGATRTTTGVLIDRNTVVLEETKR